MRNKILKSANTKYHYFYFFSIELGDLPLMYSAFLVGEFIDLVENKNRLNRGIHSKHRGIHQK